MSDQEQAPTEETETEGSAERREPKVIKRYTNRKLYDTVESRYVTLDEIAQMIKGGAEVKIIDNRTKEDLTSVTLAQIIFEEEKKRSQMPLGVLREIIRHGGEAVAGFYQEKVGQRLSERISEVKSRTESLRDDIEQKVRTVLPALLRREDKVEKKDAAPEGEPPKDGEGKPAAPIKDLFAAGQRAIEELQGKVDQSVKQAIEGLAGASLAELQRLQRQVESLEKKIEQLTHRQ
jgi:polyhydroxyalkanoate synthesis repressor PhaR